MCNLCSSSTKREVRQEVPHREDHLNVNLHMDDHLKGLLPICEGQVNERTGTLNSHPIEERVVQSGQSHQENGWLKRLNCSNHNKIFNILQRKIIY